MTPQVKIPESLSAKFKSSFAYKTVKDRMPVIVTKVIDTCHRQRHNISFEFGEEGSSQLKHVVGQLSELRYRLSTNKPLLEISDSRADVTLWNSGLDLYSKLEDSKNVTWFNGPWLFVECYMYRKIAEAFHSTSLLRSFDVFSFQKQEAFISSLNLMENTAKYLFKWKSDQNANHNVADETSFNAFFQISLWGNRFDLSMSCGEITTYSKSPIDQIHELKSFLLHDDSAKVYRFLQKLKSDNRRIDIILDNAGLELFGDLCLAEFLICSGLADKVIFHVKSMPWFISDTTHKDFAWTLEMLKLSHVELLGKLGTLWYDRLDNSSFLIMEHAFWTTGYPFNKMKSVASDLYDHLSTSDLVIFKGDLNYRKLIGDLQWKFDTTFKESLLDFHPAPLVTLRTCKADTVVGVETSLIEKIERTHPDYLTSGEFAVVQFDGENNQ